MKFVFNFIFCVLTSSLTLFTDGLAASEQPQLSTPISVVSEYMPPYQYYDNQGIKTGYSVEIVNQLLEHAELPQEITYLPWPRAYKMALKNPNTLIFSILRTAAREPLFNWIGELELEEYFYYKLASNEELKESNTADYAVTAYNGSPYLNYLNEQKFSRIELTDSLEQSVKMLYSKRADILFTSDHVLKSLMRKLKIDEKAIVRISDQPQFTADLYIAMSKNSDPELVKKLQLAYQKLVENRQLALLQEKLKNKH